MASMGEAVTALCPSASFVCSGTYESLRWYDTTVPKPTEEAIAEKQAELTASLPMQRLRFHRNDLLAQSDKYVVPDWEHPTKELWVGYRQALRDLPQTYADDPDSAVFPAPPA